MNLRQPTAQAFTARVDTRGCTRLIEAPPAAAPVCELPALAVEPQPDGSALLIGDGRPLGIFVSVDLAGRTREFLGGNGR